MSVFKTVALHEAASGINKWDIAMANNQIRHEKKEIASHRTLYVSKYMLGVPSEVFGLAIADIAEFDELVFSKVDSKLEAMVLMGMIYCILKRKYADAGTDAELIERLKVNGHSVYVSDGAIWFMEPWEGWSSNGCGPSSMSIVLQHVHNERRRDFAIFTQGRDNGSPPIIPDDLLFLVEVDGYAVHSGRREQDNIRDGSAECPVFVFREEHHWPKTFWDKAVLPYLDSLEEEMMQSEVGGEWYE